ncbi:N-acetyltransferase [Lysobacter sp. TY2-98]|uniref:GNAT family N-acetyltransferase n=1 Tax=Lysobacter sp. TY2-98 TaxID=2290922 RepID=UPI000E206288|nr:GNAT family N-acetyltransferase [Lysobacter sp. TY2-98]AXK73102.1 N-acetyltransferase [Lysobacter sp. TY2-98]
MTRMRNATRLRLVDEGDRDLYRTLYSSQDVMRAIGEPLDRETIDAQLSRVVAHNRSNKPGHRAWVIETLTDGHGVGLAALLREGNSAEFGVMLLPGAWQRGIGTATIRRLLLHAFEEMRVELVHASSQSTRAGVIGRLLAPFNLERQDSERLGDSRWLLTRDRWMRERCDLPDPADRSPVSRDA